jgi:hypothetical protein
MHYHVCLSEKCVFFEGIHPFDPLSTLGSYRFLVKSEALSWLLRNFLDWKIFLH